jgi:hypothetical protein
MDRSFITLFLPRMNKLDQTLISYGAATFGNYAQRVSRLARFELYNDKLNRQKKVVEQARARALQEIKDRTDIVVAAHTLISLKTDSISSANLPLASDYEDVLPILSTPRRPSPEAW